MCAQNALPRVHRAQPVPSTPLALEAQVVQAAVAAAAKDEGLALVEGGAYVIGKLPAVIAAEADAALGPA